MEELAVLVPHNYRKSTPTPQVQHGSCHDLTVKCNGKIFKLGDYKTEKEWRLAVAEECGFTDASWTAYDHNYKMEARR